MWAPLALRVVGPGTFTALVGAYLIRVHMGPRETLALCLGAIALWGPFAWGVDHFVRREVADGAVRFAVALAGSYAFTSFAWFLSSVAGAPAALYAAQAAVVLGAAVQEWRRRAVPGRSRSRFAVRPNWLLLCLVSLALFTMAPYAKVAEVTTAGSRNLRIPADSLYYTSQAYEVVRGLPPRQDPTRAGTPARSYHLLPHVTTVLLARATAQPDLLRAQIMYHLTILTIAVSVVLYALGTVLAGRRFGGYTLVALLYPLAVVGPPLLEGTTVEGRSFFEYYFTPLPQLSSMLDPVALASWQSYSAILVALGLLLVVAMASVHSDDGRPCRRLLVVAALLVAALSRFRVQIFIVALPGFLLVIALAWHRTRRRDVIGIGLVALLASLPPFIEAASSTYRAGTSSLQLAFNGLTVRGNVVGRVDASPILTGWPFSDAVHDRLAKLVSGTAFLWAWQVVCLTAFVLLNVIGILGTVCVGVYLTRRVAWGRLRLLTALIAVMTVGSVLIGILVKSDFDSFSLSGQALFLPVWYVFPLIAVVGAWALSLLQDRARLRPRTWIWLGVSVVVLGAWAREVGPASPLADFEYHNKILSGQEISQDRWRLLGRLHDHTPKSAVIISNQYNDYRILFSGIAGRAAYLEAVGDINDTEAQRIDGDDRPAVVAALWSTQDPGRFCDLLRNTPSTHLVEFTDQPLAVLSPPCLALDWSSPAGEARIWLVH